jgi:hypothetical protein
MDEKREQGTIVVNINLTRVGAALLIGFLLMVAVAGYLAWGTEGAVASAPQAPDASSSGMRRYYRTSDSFRPTEVFTACAAGYHFASIWEILDPSNLEYNSILGDYQADSGYGPLSGRRGWVQTGYNSSGSSGLAGQDNCQAWTSNDGGYYGTSVELEHSWVGGTQEVGTWDVGLDTCDTRVPVWCVEDY